MTTDLFDPITLRGVTFRNRLWVSPMCQYSVIERDGVPRVWHWAHLGALARGGAGAVIVEATAVSPEGRLTPQDLGLWNDEQATAFVPIVGFAKSMGARIGIQLGHGGRKASAFPEWGYDGQQGSMDGSVGGWETVAPSPIPFEGMATPKEMTHDDIDQLVHDFAAAAHRAVACGFEFIEIHAAHGYLLHEFLSPLSNRRADFYGGSLANRARVLLEVVGAVRERVPDLPLLVRLSAVDWHDGGVTLDETVKVAQWLTEAGVDLLDISSGGIVPGLAIPLSPGYQVPFARAVAEATGIPTSSVGLITSAEQARDVLSDGLVDVVLVGREFLRNPHFALAAAAEHKVIDELRPPQYARAYR